MFPNSGARAGRSVNLAPRARLRAKSTAGIYRLADHGGWRPVGGGVCLRLGGRVFVLGTGGVLAASGGPLWLGGRCAMVPLLGAAVLDRGRKGPPEVATIDAAFGILAGDDAAALAHDLEFLSLSEVDVAEGAADDIYYAVPAAPHGQEPGRAAIASGDHVRLRMAPAADYRRCGVTAATHLVLRPEGAVDGEWSLSRLHSCGVWRVTPGGRDPLAGIVSGASDGPAALQITATRPCFTVLGIMSCLWAAPPEGTPVRRRN